jgi:protein SCO1/2
MVCLLSACSPDTSEVVAGSSTEGGHEGHVDMAAGEPISGHSLHHLKGQWTDQHGNTVQLANFSGKVVVLAMVYTHCDNACPRIIADMRRIRQQLPGQRDNLVFALASIDPQRDTVAHLKQFGEDTGLTEQGWRLLRADEDTCRELAAVLGVQYRRISDIDFAHSNMINVLGPDGVIAHQQIGLGISPDATVTAIEAL